MDLILDHLTMVPGLLMHDRDGSALHTPLVPNGKAWGSCPNELKWPWIMVMNPHGLEQGRAIMPAGCEELAHC